MAKNSSFEVFQGRYRSSGDFVEKRDLLEEHIEAAGSWNAERCTYWIIGLSAWAEDWVEGIDPEPVGDLDTAGDPALRDEVDLLSIDLAQALIDRLEALHRSLPLDQIARLLEGVARRGGAFELPRPALMELHHRWVDSGFIPGLEAYRRQVSDRATAEEAVEIVERLFYSPGQPRDNVAEWIDLAFERAIRVRPDVLPRWIEVLREGLSDEPDPYVEAIVDHCQRWLDLARGPEGLPDAVRRYLSMRSVSPDKVEWVKEALATQDPSASWTVRLPDVMAILDRDAQLARPPLKTHIDESAYPEAREAIVAYRQLCLLGSDTDLLACDLLTMAVYRQLLGAVREAFPDTAVDLGLGDLVCLLDGNTIDTCSLTLAPSREDHAVRKDVRECRDIRNKIHHPERALRSRDRRRLERLILDRDGSRVLEKIARMKLRRHGA